jgi:hypothetical protein
MKHSVTCTYRFLTVWITRTTYTFPNQFSALPTVCSQNLSVRLFMWAHLTVRETRNEFSWNQILLCLSETYRHIPAWLKSDKNSEHFDIYRSAWKVFGSGLGSQDSNQQWQNAAGFREEFFLRKENVTLSCTHFKRSWHSRITQTNSIDFIFSGIFVGPRNTSR